MENQKELFSNPEIFTRAMYVQNIRFSVDISGEAILKLKKAMNLCNVNYDGSDPEQKEAADFFTNEFFPYINDLATKLEEQEARD